jgi:uncharacterized membrane protein
MKAIFISVIIGVSVILVLTLFTWMVYHASGHNIPVKTDRAFMIIVSITAIILTVAFVYLRKSKMKV